MSAMSFRRLFAVLICATGAVAIAFAFTQIPGLRRFTEPIEARTLDWRMRASPMHADPANAPVVLVLFDSASVAQWSWQSPVPRSALAQIIDIVAKAGASAIGVDVFLDRRYPRLEEIDGGDTRLRDVIRAAGNVILAAKTAGTADGRIVVAPDPYFADVAAGYAPVELPATGARARNAVLVVRAAGDRLTPTLPLALYARYHGLDAGALLVDADSTGMIDLPTSGIPLRVRGGDAAVTLPLRHLGPPGRPNRIDGAFPAYAATAVIELNARVPAEWFRGRIVLIGAGVHQEPAYRSPFSSGTPGAPGWLYGTEVMATATENLVRSRFIVQPNVAAALALLFGLSLIVATSTFSAGRLGAASISLFFAAATIAAAWAGLDGADLQIPIVAPLLTIALAFFGSSAYAAYGDGLKRRRIRLGFAGHVAPAVAAQLSRQPERLRSEGDRRNVTVLTANLSGLNGLSARLEPERLVALMNPCLDELIQLIIEEGGSVDTAMGGALEAVFGAPAENAQHAAAACRAALQMRKRLRDRARSWDLQGSHRVDLHAGIDTGDTIVGSIGGTHRFAYSAVGEPVGVSAALEGLCARYEIGVLVTENVVTAAGKAIRVREIDRVAIHEDESPLRVFELIGLADEPPAWPVQFLGFWQRGLDAYRQRDFSLAADFFLAAAELDPADTPSTMYLERCRAFVAAPPPEDWDDVQRWEMR